MIGDMLSFDHLHIVKSQFGKVCSGSRLSDHSLQSASSQPNLKRVEIKAMLADWEKRYPGRVENIFRSLRNIVPSHLMDELYPFDSPNPNELLDYRSENPLDEASEIREASYKRNLIRGLKCDRY